MPTQVSDQDEYKTSNSRAPSPLLGTLDMRENHMTESVFYERVRALQGPQWQIIWVILCNGADCNDTIQEALLQG